jgi:diphthine synthase
MLTFIGLGLFDEYDISLKGLEAIRKADLVYAEFYTSCLMGTNLDKME